MLTISTHVETEAVQQPPRRRGRPKSVQAEKHAAGIQTLDRALSVLETVAVHQGLTLTQIATQLGEAPATTYRILCTLAARRYVENDPDRQVWFVGPEAFRLGSAFLRRTNVVECSRPIMWDLMTKTGETANLGVERGRDVMFISQVETHETIRAFFPPGTRSPLHASGIGKALLSLFDADRLCTFLRDAELTCFTDKTITSACALREELQRARAKGYALDDEERTVGMRCVAAPIRDGIGEPVAGISVSGPTIRMSKDRVSEIGRLVAEAATSISHRLGAPTLRTD